MFDRIPKTLQAITALAAAFVLGGSVTVAAGAQRGLPDRVTKLEQQQAKTDQYVGFLVCRELERDAGRDPAACRYLLQGVDVQDLLPRSRS